MIEIAFDKDPLSAGRVWVAKDNPLRLVRIRRVWQSTPHNEPGVGYDIWDRSDTHAEPWEIGSALDASLFRERYVYDPTNLGNVEYEHQVAEYCLKRAAFLVEGYLEDGVVQGDAEAYVALFMKAVRYEAATRIRMQPWGWKIAAKEAADLIGERLTQEEMDELLPW
jgi:hypothetical protein